MTLIKRLKYQVKRPSFRRTVVGVLGAALVVGECAFVILILTRVLGSAS